MSVIVLADTVAVRSVPVIASWAPITSPFRIRSSISPPPAVVPAVQMTSPPVISQMRSLGVAGGAQLLARRELARAHARNDDLELFVGQPLEQSAAAERTVPGHFARTARCGIHFRLERKRDPAGSSRKEILTAA